MLLRGVRNQSLYYLDAKCIVGDTELNASNDGRLCHRRLGHIGERSLNELVRHKILKNCTGFKSSDCEYCILGKSKKLPYGTSTHISKAPLDYAHSDMWGPSRTKTLGGGKYFMSIMDDYSRKLWVYIKKSKDEAIVITP